MYGFVEGFIVRLKYKLKKLASKSIKNKLRTQLPHILIKYAYPLDDMK